MDRKAVMAEKNSQKPEDVFMRREFTGLLTRRARGLTGKNIRIKLYADERDGRVACTNGSVITENIKNPITEGFSDMEDKKDSLIGLEDHEIGHVLFTDFDGAKEFYASVQESLESAKPEEFISEGDEESFDGMADAYEKNACARNFLTSLLHYVENVYEDAVIEAKMCQKFPGDAKRGILLNRWQQYMQSKSLGEMLKEADGNELAALTGVILTYALFGRYPNWEKLKNRITDFMEEAQTEIDRGLSLRRLRDREDSVLRVLSHMWPLIKEQLEEMEEIENPSGESGGGSEDSGKGRSSGSGNPSGESGNGETGKSSENGSGSGNEYADGNGENPERGEGNGDSESGGESERGESGSADAEGSGPENKTSSEGNAEKEEEKASGGKSPFKEREKETQAQKEARESLEDLIKSLFVGNTDDPEGEGEGDSSEIPNIRDFTPPEGGERQDGGRFTTEGREAEWRNAFSESFEETEAPEFDTDAELEKLRTQLAKEAVEEREERELERTLETELSESDLTALHDVDRHIVRISDPSAYRAAYREISAETKRVAKALSREIDKVIKPEAERDEKGLYFGKKLTRGDYYRPDGKLFSKRNLPSDERSLSIGLVVDESGSMWSGGRIEAAKLTALTLYEFCRMRKIPLMCVGHRVIDIGVEIDSFCDFNSSDGNDGLRLMAIEPGGCNRDGLALRYVGEKLMKRPENVKLLIIISDGQPNDRGYGGEVARDDLRSAKRRFKGKGVITLAAAIGDDKDVIKEIYGDGFLDVTDLKKLPVKLCRLVGSYLKV